MQKEQQEAEASNSSHKDGTGLVRQVQTLAGMSFPSQCLLSCVIGPVAFLHALSCKQSAHGVDAMYDTINAIPSYSLCRHCAAGFRSVFALTLRAINRQCCIGVTLTYWDASSYVVFVQGALHKPDMCPCVGCG